MRGSDMSPNAVSHRQPTVIEIATNSIPLIIVTTKNSNEGITDNPHDQFCFDGSYK